MGNLTKNKGWRNHQSSQLKNTELEEERKRNHVDFSAIDTQMKSEYEKRLSHATVVDEFATNISLLLLLKKNSARLKAELVKLRRMYEEETEKAKQEFMYLHSSKVKPFIQTVQM